MTELELDPEVEAAFAEAAHEHPPAFLNPGEGLLSLDEIAAQEQMQFMAEQAAKDPRQQIYFVRADRNTVVKTQEEHAECIEKAIRLSLVGYKDAVKALQNEERRTRTKVKNRKKNKVARQSRKKNR